MMTNRQIFLSKYAIDAPSRMIVISLFFLYGGIFQPLFPFHLALKSHIIIMTNSPGIFLGHIWFDFKEMIFVTLRRKQTF